jgi:hypothetical protein
VWTSRLFLHVQDAGRVLPGEGPYQGHSLLTQSPAFPTVCTGPASFYTRSPHGCAQQTGKKFSCSD